MTTQGLARYKKSLADLSQRVEEMGDEESQAEEVPEGMEEEPEQPERPQRQEPRSVPLPRREQVILEILTMLGQDTSLDIDYTKDARVVKLMSLDEESLAATYLYIKSQRDKTLNQTVIQQSILQLANLVYRLGNSKEDMEKVKQDKELRYALEQQLGGVLELVPNQFKLIFLAGAHVLNAISKRFFNRENSALAAPPVQAYNVGTK